MREFSLATQLGRTLSILVAAHFCLVVAGEEFRTAKRGALLHTGMLFSKDDKEPLGAIAAELRSLAKKHGASLEEVVKLNLYSASSDPSVLERIRSEFVEIWNDPSVRPALTLIPSPSPGETHLAADAVVSLSGYEGGEVDPKISDQGAVLPPGCDILYVSGRAASGELAPASAQTMVQLFDVLSHLGAGKKNVVQVKAFIQPMEEWEIVEKAIRESFTGNRVPPLVFVEWNSSSRATEIELIATVVANKESQLGVSYFTPPGDKPSPVFSRVARISGDAVVYIGGVIGSTTTSPEAQVRSLFSELQRITAEAGSGLLNLAKATYYVSESGVSTALNKLRPEYYDPKRPPAASKVQIPSIGVEDRHLLIDLIAAPRP